MSSEFSCYSPALLKHLKIMTGVRIPISNAIVNERKCPSIIQTFHPFSLVSYVNQTIIMPDSLQVFKLDIIS